MKQFGEIVTGVDYYERPGSYAVILENEKIGVIKSDVFGQYFLIGGGISRGESELDALRREALEEIGCEIEILEKIGAAAEHFYAQPDGKYILKICNFYRVNVKELTDRFAESRLCWIDRGELHEMYHRSHQWIVETELAKQDLLP
jgi:8-oxo-dGTP diphosphatase